MPNSVLDAVASAMLCLIVILGVFVAFLIGYGIKMLVDYWGDS